MQLRTDKKQRYNDQHVNIKDQIKKMEMEKNGNGKRKKI